MTRTFADFARRFRDKPAQTSKPRPTTLNSKRRQLTGQIADIIQELHNLPELTDTDHRVLNISSAVAFLLAER